MFSSEIQASLAYLTTPESSASLARDPYWPKWHSPWWHMLTLHEMGEKLPASAVENLIVALNQYPLKIFPIQPSDMPEGLDPYRHTCCHCMIGSGYKILSAAGVPVDERVPWLRPWMLRYQMADGGLSCDSEAYLARGECPSSMVGTIPPFEAILLHTPRPFTTEEELFVDRCAAFLIGRRLTEGSSTNHNAEEREQALAWKSLCFPRLYLYDVLRGLSVLLHWAELRGRPVPWDSIRETVTLLEGGVKNERFSYERCTTMLPGASGEWLGRQPATFFPLLTSASKLGPSPFLEREWANTSARLARLRAAGLVR